MVTVAFFDPSARTGKQHDFKAIVVGTLINSLFYVRYAYIRRATVSQVIDQLYLIDRKFPGIIIGYEENGFQQLYENLLNDYEAPKRGYRLNLAPVTNTGNKEAGIEGLSGLVETGGILFQKDADGYTSDIGLLVEQMLDFPGGKHDDGPDALRCAYNLAKNKAFRVAHASSRKQPERPTRRSPIQRRSFRR